MRKPENTFISGMHKYLPSESELHREKMHNAYRGGTADWWYSGVTLDLWIEYKYEAFLPKRDSTIVVPSLSPLQREWTERRFKENRHVYVVHGTREGAVVFLSPTEWLDGLTTAECRSRLLARPALAALIAKHCNEGAVLGANSPGSNQVRSLTG